MTKNIKISEKHHQILKSYCDRTGLRMYRVIEKWIDELDKSKKEGFKTRRDKDIYDET